MVYVVGVSDVSSIHCCDTVDLATGRLCKNVLQFSGDPTQGWRVKQKLPVVCLYVCGLQVPAGVHKTECVCGLQVPTGVHKTEDE